MSLARPIADDLVISAIRPTPLVQSALEELAARRVAERRSLAKKLSELIKAENVAFAKRQGQVEEATKAYHRAEAALRDAASKLRQAHTSRSAASFEFTREHDTLEAALIATASPEIDEFIAEARAILWSPPQPTLVEASSRRHPLTGIRQEVRVTNFDAVHAYIDAVRLAMHEAEAMRLDPDQSTVTARLAALRASFPKY